MPASIHQSLRRAATGFAIAAALAAPGIAQAAPVGDAATPAPAGPVVDPDLCAVAGTVDLPGAAATPIWGFAQGTDCSAVTPGLPGPVIEVPAGSSVVLNFKNTLDTALEITLPGITLDPGPTTVPAHNAVPVPITFTAPSTPGTYLYSSVGDAGRQQLMGLYGALLVCNGACSSSGSEAGSAYDRAATLVLSEIDTHFNADPDGEGGFSMNDYDPDYWLVNGRPHTDSSSDIAATAGDRVLLRYLSAGPSTVSMTMLGMHAKVLARDTYALSNPVDVVSETVPAGSTADMIATVPSGTPSGTRLPLYNRQLRLNNGAAGKAQFAPADGGGMLTFIHVP
jgi:FtsP/CotA-like multicopper oxidase with cupredoxin domain